MDNGRIDSQLLFAQNAISNTMNQPELASPLAEYGYTEEKLKVGNALYKTAMELQNKQKKEYGDQYGATYELNAAKAGANATYMKHLKIARVVFGRDPGVSEALQLAGTRSRTFSGWLSQAKALYANALGEFGITKNKLKEAQALITDCEDKYNSQLKEKGEAQTATRERDKALDTLDRWVSDFVAIARIALESNPQYLEMLGIVEPD